MIMLPNVPRFDAKADPSTQVIVLKKWCEDLKNELEATLADIKLENLDPSLQNVFKKVSDALITIEYAIQNVNQNVAQNYSSDTELDESYAKKTEVQSVSSRVTTIENNYVTSSVTDDLSTRITNVANRTTDLEQKSVTTDNTETIIADKNLKVAGVMIGSNTYTEQTATIDGTTIHFLGY